MNNEKQPDSTTKEYSYHSHLPPKNVERLYQSISAGKITDVYTAKCEAACGDISLHEWTKYQPKLSVLLATVENRAEQFSKLHAEFKRQAEGKSVEIIVACDNKQISIGKKRDNLLRAASGDYILFADDDDWISPDYVDKILAALETSPDCVGFLFECSRDGRKYGMAKVSLRYRAWADNVDGYKHVRNPHHKVPVKREIALAVGFPDMRYGEDKVYSDGILPYLKTEVFINEALYFYRFSNKEPFHLKYGTNRKNMKGINFQHVRKKFFT